MKHSERRRIPISVVKKNTIKTKEEALEIGKDIFILLHPQVNKNSSIPYINISPTNHQVLMQKQQG